MRFFSLDTIPIFSALRLSHESTPHFHCVLSLAVTQLSVSSICSYRLHASYDDKGGLVCNPYKASQSVGILDIGLEDLYPFITLWAFTRSQPAVLFYPADYEMLVVHEYPHWGYDLWSREQSRCFDYPLAQGDKYTLGLHFVDIESRVGLGRFMGRLKNHLF